MEDISTILTMEVKKEIADRYFGFRKIIEEDSQLYMHNINLLSQQLRETIEPAILGIFWLLHDDVLIQSFTSLTHLPGQLFPPPEKFSSHPFSEAANHSIKPRGFTRRRRFTNLFFDRYISLERSISSYIIELEDLHDEHSALVDQITIFYKNNDISGIMHFLQGLDNVAGNSTTPFHSIPDSQSNALLDEKMKISPPPPVTQFLPVIPPLPPFKSIRRQLKPLGSKAYASHPDSDLNWL